MKPTVKKGARGVEGADQWARTRVLVRVYREAGRF
jgi:hypothetical protein